MAQKALLMLNMHSKQISLLVFFYFKLWALLWTHCGAYSNSSNICDNLFLDYLVKTVLKSHHLQPVQTKLNWDFLTLLNLLVKIVKSWFYLVQTWFIFLWGSCYGTGLNMSNIVISWQFLLFFLFKGNIND